MENSTSIIEQFIYEYNQIKKEKDEYYKNSQFYSKQVFLICDYLRNHKPNPEYAWLYKIIETFWKDCWIKNAWSPYTCFAMPFYHKNDEIYNDPCYDYERENDVRMNKI